MKFKVGDKVKITKSSEYYRNNDEYNPINEIGTISRYSDATYSGHLNINVSWNNDKSNSYNNKDLELVEENMNQEIEVGDIVTYDRGQFEDFTNKEVVRIEGDRLYIKHPTMSAANMSVYNAVLVSKANKGEIVGYKLLKDLPGIPAGSKFNKLADSLNLYSANYSYTFKQEQLQDTTWFKPIYKPKEVVVKISKGREVRVNNTQVEVVGQDVSSHKEFSDIWTYITKPQRVNFRKEYTFEILTFKIGCQEFTKEDINSVYQAIQNLK